MAAIFRRGQAIVPEGNTVIEADDEVFFVAAAEHIHAVMGELRQRFFVRVTERDDGVSVRLDPTTDPEKTPAVHRALALVADELRRKSPGSTVRSTNIADAVGEAEARD